MSIMDISLSENLKVNENAEIGDEKPRVSVVLPSPNEMSILGNWWNCFTCGSRRLEGPFRVIVFCLLAIVLPCLLLIFPLYIRYEYFKDVEYNLRESDLVTVDQRISTFWCSEQELRMNTPFNAYLLNEQPKITDLKQIEMQKHLQLEPDTLEYLRFFLLQGSRVTLRVCSRFDGARLMVVNGTNLKHCGLDSSQNDQTDPWEGVSNVTFQQAETQTLAHLYQKNRSNVSNLAHLNNSTGPSAAISVTTPRTGATMDQIGVTVIPQSDGSKRRRSIGRKLRFLSTSSILIQISSSDEPTNQIQEFHGNFKIQRENDESHEKEADPTNGTERAGEDETPIPVDLEAEAGKPFDEEDTSSSSGSYFAKKVWSCYGGETLLTETYSPNPQCDNQEAVTKHVRMVVHEVTSTGFNIEMPEYSFPYYANSCLNSTNCKLPLALLSWEKVLLQVPIQDGVSDEDGLPQILLISSCKPRLIVYLIFPIVILFVIISCAFI